MRAGGPRVCVPLTSPFPLAADSEATASSDNSDGDGPKGAAEPPPLKR